jgi:hypothetical protein
MLSPVMSTATGPMPSSKTNLPKVAPPSGSRLARTAAVPTVGCPANGTSSPGVKIRTRQV